MYERAYKILLVPVNNLNAPLFTVAMPMLSRLAKQPEQYRRAYLSMVEKLNMVVMPCAALLIAMPDQIVRALFGEQWLAASPIVAWLGVASLYQPIAYTCGWLFMTQDRTREMFWWGIYGSALSAVTIVAGLPFGATGVAASFAVGGPGDSFAGPVLDGGPAWSGLRLGYGQKLGPSTLATALIVVTLFALRRWDVFASLTLPRSLGVSGLSMAVIAFSCFLCVPQSRHAIWEMAKLKKHTRTEACRCVITRRTAPYPMVSIRTSGGELGNLRPRRPGVEHLVSPDNGPRKPLRIAMFVNEFPALSETFVLNQITGLLDLGHDVTIFANWTAP